MLDSNLQVMMVRRLMKIQDKSECKDQEKETNDNNTNYVNAAGTNRVNVVEANTNNELPFDPFPFSNEDEDISTFPFSNEDEDDGIGDLHSATQTRNMSKNLEEHGFVTTIHQRTNHKDLQNCLFACFLSQEEPTKAIGTKWVFRKKKNERGIVIGNKARLVSQGHTREEDIVYDEVFALVARIEAIRLFLAYASFKDFMKDLYNAFEKMMHEKFQMSSMEELIFFLGLQVKQKQDGIFISQDKHVAEILKKYGFLEVKNASTQMETQKPMLKDEDKKEVDVHMYRSMIGLLMYLTSSRPDIMYLRGHLKLGLWYLKDSPFDLVAYTNSDYAGASLDRKSTIGGCQYIGCRLISWQCKKQIMVLNSITEAEYVAASSCCG
nr:ribonuclease H-like domain, reverse transcriptase, RNA-dependent DNA polymerase [Tanacetum cinerariifolium]